MKHRSTISTGWQRRVLVHGWVVALLSGCELGANLEGLAQELGNPDTQNVEVPGRVVAEGRYRGLSFDGTTADGPFVLAIKDAKSADHTRTLSIIPFAEGEACSVGSADRFEPSLSRTDDPDVRRDARIPFVVPAPKPEPPAEGAEPEAPVEGPPPELRFTNFDCEVDDVSVPHGLLPLANDFGPVPGFVVQAQDRIYFVNPWANEKTLIAEDTIAIHGQNTRALFAEGSGGQRWMWTIEGLELVARDANFKETFRAGQNVERILHHSTGQGAPLLVLLDKDKNVFTAFSDKPADIKKVASDACAVQVNVGEHGRELLHYSPCDARNLVVLELETDTKRQVRDQILDYKIVGATDTGPALLYLADASETNRGKLWVRWGQNEPIHLGDNGHLGLSRVNSRGEARVVVDWTDAGGTLLVGDLGSELEVMAEAVVYNSSAGLITDFDGKNGILRRFDEDATLQTVANNISTEGIRNDNQRDRTLLISDYDGASGTLVLLEGDRLRELAKNVTPGMYAFTVQQQRVTVLSDWDQEANTAVLKVPSTEYDDEGFVNEGVAESLEVDWPSKGMLYSAPEADPPGIYFAKFF